MDGSPGKWMTGRHWNAFLQRPNNLWVAEGLAELQESGLGISELFESESRRGCWSGFESALVEEALYPSNNALYPRKG